MLKCFFIRFILTLSSRNIALGCNRCRMEQYNNVLQKIKNTIIIEKAIR